tara:strand:+ start:52582 stop:52917 length:336 start_codon:yes stop_codon:yes gene_type:complete
MNPAENYILKQQEPFRSILIQIQVIIEATVPDLDLKYKWRLPYYYYKQKPFCFLNVTKGYVDIGFRDNEHLKFFDQYLVKENRKVMKSLRYFSLKDIDQEVLIGVILGLKK